MRGDINRTVRIANKGLKIVHLKRFPIDRRFRDRDDVDCILFGQTDVVILGKVICRGHDLRQSISNAMLFPDVLSVETV